MQGAGPERLAEGSGGAGPSEGGATNGGDGTDAGRPEGGTTNGHEWSRIASARRCGVSPWLSPVARWSSIKA